MNNNIEKTKTTAFILPLLRISKRLYMPYIYNAYLFTQKDDSFGVIYVVFKWSGNLKYEKTLEVFRDSDNYRGEYTICDESYTVFIMSIPDEFKREYELFLLGKYSEFSEEAKRVICRDLDSSSKVPDILTKSNKLKQFWEDKIGCCIPESSELWSIYDREEETFSADLLEPANNF